MHQAVRERLLRDPQPSAGVVDSQSVKTTDVGGKECGYDGAKKDIKGRKCYLLVDTQGLVLRAKVYSADIADRDGIKVAAEAREGSVCASFPPMAGRGLQGQEQRVGGEGDGRSRSCSTRRG